MSPVQVIRPIAQETKQIFNAQSVILLQLAYV